MIQTCSIKFYKIFEICYLIIKLLNHVPSKLYKQFHKFIADYIQFMIRISKINKQTMNDVSISIKNIISYLAYEIKRSIKKLNLK